MTFMNKKEEVLDIKLTQYGKRLLSQGKFDPVYYTFHDEGVLYDSEYASYEEPQNNIEGRILDETPNLRTQHNFVAAKDSGGIIKVKNPDGSTREIDIYQVLSRGALSGELGQSEFGNQNFPSLVLHIDGGEITSVNNFRDKYGKQIPQIECEIKAKAQVRNISDVQKYEEPFETAISPVAPDGTYLSINLPNFILQLVEENTDFNTENFDMEVFKINTELLTGDQTLVPLDFVSQNRQSNIVNNILLDSEEDPDENFVLPTVDNVEYYFMMNKDGDILPQIIEQSSFSSKSRSFYSDSGTTTIKDKASLAISDIYSSTSDTDDIEDCG